MIRAIAQQVSAWFPKISNRRVCRATASYFSLSDWWPMHRCNGA